MNMAAAIVIAAVATLTPTVTCIIAYLLWRQDVRRLEEKLEAFKDGTNGRFEAMGSRIDEVKESCLRDALLILRSRTGLQERVAKVEAGQGRQFRQPAISPEGGNLSTRGSSTDHASVRGCFLRDGGGMCLGAAS